MAPGDGSNPSSPFDVVATTTERKPALRYGRGPRECWNEHEAVEPGREGAGE